MLKSTLTFAFIGTSLLFGANAALSDANVDHFSGKASDSLAQAFANIKEHNKVLENVAAKKTLTALDSHNVHEATYTLEKALEKIKAELEATQVSLELLHKASEKNATDEIKPLIEKYLKESKRFSYVEKSH